MYAALTAAETSGARDGKPGEPTSNFASCRLTQVRAAASRSFDYGVACDVGARAQLELKQLVGLVCRLARRLSLSIQTGSFWLSASQLFGTESAANATPGSVASIMVENYREQSSKV